jgi:2-polyprenyl-3-methyl-5-hydroxy-6-metoxy-1,4-benzoquinol methylase
MHSEIIYLSKEQSVSMGDAWFDIATIDHFWIRRRFDVFRKLTKGFDWPRARIGEIGCGSGLVQRQMEDAFGVAVDGFDLNVLALEKSVSRTSSRYCYNVFAKDSSLKEVYDAIFLFDVIEHLDDDKGFTEAVIYHLKLGGHLFINVPADPKLFSSYDDAAGHKRRYLVDGLFALAQSLNMQVVQITYWGMLLRWLLRLRKMIYKNVQSKDEVLTKGFSPRSGIGNFGLRLLSAIDYIPQTNFLGGSLMAILRKS